MTDKRRPPRRRDVRKAANAMRYRQLVQRPTAVEIRQRLDAIIEKTLGTYGLTNKIRRIARMAYQLGIENGHWEIEKPEAQALKQGDASAGPAQADTPKDGVVINSGP